MEQNNGGTYTELIYSPTGFKMQVVSGASNVAEYAPMPGGGASVWTPSGFYYRHGDWLGSSRFASTKSRTVYYDAAYAPFGQPYAETGTTDRNFTGMDQGTVSGLYDFPAREYNGLEGRWPSPDPAGLASVDPTDPQTWNRYAYVRNSPLAMVDPTGLCGEADSYSYDANGNLVVTGYQPCFWDILQYFGYGGFATMYMGYYPSGGGGGSGTGGGGSATVSGNQPQTPQTPTQTAKQRIKSFLDQHPKTKWYFCGSNPRDALRAYLIEGAVKGALIGGVATAWGGGLVLAGAAGGAVVGAADGAVVGPIAIAGCSAIGVYN